MPKIVDPEGLEEFCRLFLFDRPPFVLISLPLQKIVISAPLETGDHSLTLRVEDMQGLTGMKLHTDYSVEIRIKPRIDINFEIDERN